MKNIIIKTFTAMNKSTQPCGDCETTKDASEKGHLECLERLHKLGCSWDADTCNYAAEGGHLECLKYAHENKCPWDKKTCSAAYYNNNLECLNYAHENYCPCGHLSKKIKKYDVCSDVPSPSKKHF